MHERTSEEEFGKDWNFPCFALLNEHRDFLSQQNGGGRDHMKASHKSGATLKSMQRERRHYH